MKMKEQQLHRSEYLKKSLIASALLVLAFTSVSLPASAAKSLPKPPYWFECTAGYKVFPDRMDVRFINGNPEVWLLGIDIYQVHASSFGPSYDLVIYYWFNPASAEVELIALFASRDIGLIPYGGDFSVARKGLTIAASNLPLGQYPKAFEVTANPSASRPEKIPAAFQTIPVTGMTVTFDGTWSAIPPTAYPMSTEYFVFNVRVTITPTISA